jgi:large repetitive protein
MRRQLLILLLLSLFSLTAKATHMSGGEIYWDCIGPNQYRITMVIYRDCFGINVDPSYNLVLTSPCGNRNLTVSTPGGVEISQLCDIELPNSTCNGGNLPGIQQYIYTGVITLPPCNSWTVSYTNIYRNAAVANLTNPGQQRTYIRAVFNTVDAPCNDSPQFTNTAIPYVCLGYPITYSFGAFDPESDSLSYQLIPAMGIAGAPLGYVNPHTGAQPIPGLTLNPSTGEVNFTLNTIGNWVVVVQVNHWVNGVIVGHIIRDMQFVAFPCDNIPPDPATGLVDGMTGQATQTGPRAVEVCQSGDFCFDMVISDPNANNILTAFSNVQQNLPGSTFSYTGTNPITATVCWTASTGSAGFFPFIVNVNDGACPIPAFQTYIYAVRVLPGLTATLEVIDENCLGTADGSITTNVTAGTGPYSYTWSNGGSEASISGGPGDYSVVIEDSNGCISQPLAASIGTTGLPNVANAGADLNGCVGVPVTVTGTVENATGGVWSGGQGTITGTGLTIQYTPSQADLLAGGATLTLTTTGNTTCPPATDQVFIAMANSFVDAAVVATDATCYNTANGSATFSPTTPGFTYLWNDPAAQTTATATGLAAGDYTLTVTDALGCSITLNTTVGPQDPLTLSSVIATDEGCLGQGNGTATATATGGTAPYTFTWSTGDVGPSITATSGTYTVSVTDANGCAPASGQATIGAQGQPNVANAGPDVIGCLNSLPVALSGTVTNATGGTWSGGSGTFIGNGLNVQYSPTPAEIQAGGVELTLTTTGNTVCAAASDNVFVNLSNAFLNAAVSSIDATCSDALNGSATFSPAAPGLSYLWNDPAAQTTATATGLGAGTYQVTVTDALGCDTTMSALIGPPGPVTIASLVATDEGCLGDGNGSATVSVSGGTQPYAYSWSTGAITSSISATSGTYTVSITDANGCAPATGQITIDPQGLPNEANAGPDLVGCLNALPVTLNGSVTNATSGVWSGGTGTFLGTGPVVQYMPSPAEIQTGSVLLTLTTVGNTVCPPASDQVSVALSNSFLQAAVSTTGASCNSNSDGTAIYTPEQPGLSYQWNDPSAQTTATATNLPAGTFTITVTDALGCDSSFTATIVEPAPLAIASATANAVTCNGGANGSAALNITGGTPIYTVQWSNGAMGASPNGLPAGTFTANVSDAQGCTTSTSVTIAEPPALVLTANVPDTVCVNAPVTLQANASGGTAPLSISWGGLGQGPSITSSFATSGMVSVIVVDAAGCIGPNLFLPVHVLDLPNASLLTYGDTTVCPGGSGIVGATVAGYAGAYTMVWPQLGAFGNGPFTVPIVADIDLVVEVSDACANSLNGVVALRLDEPPVVQLPPIIAEGCAPLTVTMPNLGLGSGMQYLWDLGNGNTSAAVAPVVTYNAGTYTVGLTVSTALGCTVGGSVTGQVIAHELPVAEFTASPWTTDAANGTIQFTDQSSGAITSHEWQFGDGGTANTVNPSHTYTDVGEFEVVLWVETAHGCVSSVSHTVTITPVYDITFPTAFTPNPNGGNGGVWDPNSLDNDVFYPFARFVEDFRMRIFNRWGELIFESNDMRIGWDGYYRGQLSPQDVYVVQTWFRFVDGKRIEKLTDLTLFR